jgi:hypothetical protein
MFSFAKCFFPLKVGWVRPKRGCLLTLAYYAFPDDMSLESDGGMILTGENRRTRRKNLSQCHFVHHKSRMD